MRTIAAILLATIVTGCDTAPGLGPQQPATTGRGAIVVTPVTPEPMIVGNWQVVDSGPDTISLAIRADGTFGYFFQNVPAGEFETMVGSWATYDGDAANQIGLAFAATPPGLSEMSRPFPEYSVYSLSTNTLTVADVHFARVDAVPTLLGTWRAGDGSTIELRAEGTFTSRTAGATNNVDAFVGNWAISQGRLVLTYGPTATMTIQNLTPTELTLAPGGVYQRQP